MRRKAGEGGRVGLAKKYFFIFSAEKMDQQQRRTNPAVLERVKSRSFSVPRDVHASRIQLEHRAPLPRHSEPTLSADRGSESNQNNDMDVDEHPWKFLYKHMKWPKKAEECVSCPPSGTMDMHVQTHARVVERSIDLSVLIFELFVTGVVLSFGIITFWFGTWGILDLFTVTVFGDSLAGRWQGLLTVLGMGLTALVLAVFAGRTRVADYIYQPVRPRTCERERKML